MRPFGYRRILRAAATTILLAVPAVRADQVTVDLGIVAYSIGINASIMNTDYPSDSETYTYQQLIFEGPLSMVIDGSGDTLAYVLAQDLGSANNGTLDYNFPFLSGASGSYAQTSPPMAFDASDPDPGMLSLKATSVSGTQCSGTNTVGSTINVDPTYAATVYQTILGCDSLASPNNGIPTFTITTVELPPLGEITSDGTTTVYIGEVVDAEWTVDGVISGTLSVPEPSLVWLVGGGLAALGWTRVRKRVRRSAT